MAKEPTQKELLTALIAKVDALETRVQATQAPDEPEQGIAFETGPLPEEAGEAPHNAAVTFVVSGLMQWDGDPETEGAEFYAPKGFDVEAHKKANGIDPDGLHSGLLCDGDGNPLPSITGDRFICPLITAQELAKRKMGRIV
jgi:hypothetical protein